MVKTAFLVVLVLTMTDFSIAQEVFTAGTTQQYIYIYIYIYYTHTEVNNRQLLKLFQ